MIPPARVRRCNDVAARPERPYVLYWMTAARRSSWSWALDRAVGWCRELHRPLLVFEPLRVGNRWASVRFHQFVLEGMADQARVFGAAGITYFPYLEPAPGAARGLLAALAEHAAVVVTDDWPCFFFPAMLSAASRLPVALEAVDGNGLLPIREAPNEFKTAHSFRRYVQRNLPPLLEQPDERPPTDPVVRGAVVPPGIARRWPPADPSAPLPPLPIDRAVGRVATVGGASSARAALDRFVQHGLPRYQERSHPDDGVASHLSPWLHWGHLSSHEVVDAVLRNSPFEGLGGERAGARTGFWNAGADADAFLDQIVTWRELGFNLCVQRPDFDRSTVLPDWARAALLARSGDPRPALYDIAALERANTGDAVWDAGQRELSATGVIHNAIRMVWGKRVLEWTAGPDDAFDTLVSLNDRWALDGRDPNSYTGISWVLGRYDRPWGPARPIFGTIRYMSSENSMRKWRMKRYLARWSP